MKKNSKRSQIKVGEIYGFWKVLENTPGRKINCQCTACFETEKLVDYVYLLNGKSKSCGCESRNLYKETCLEKHGVANPSQAKFVRDKVKRTTLQNFGVEHALQSPTCQAQKTKTMLARHGVEHFGQSDTFKKTRLDENLKKYGVEHYTQTDDFKQKSKETSLKNYGTEHPHQANIVKERIKKTCQEKYGVDNPSQSPAILAKQRETMLTKYGVPHAMQVREFAIKQARHGRLSTIKAHWKTGEELVCTASYEAKVVDYLNEHKIEYKWQSDVFRLEELNTTYRPDCYLSKQNLWIEIKGFKRESSMQKFTEFSKTHKTALWDKEKLLKMGILT